MLLTPSCCKREIAAIPERGVIKAPRAIFEQMPLQDAPLSPALMP